MILKLSYLIEPCQYHRYNMSSLAICSTLHWRLFLCFSIFHTLCIFSSWLLVIEAFQFSPADDHSRCSCTFDFQLKIISMALKFPISNSKNLNVKEALRLTHDIQLDSTENQTCIHPLFQLSPCETLCVCPRYDDHSFPSNGIIRNEYGKVGRKICFTLIFFFSFYGW